MEPSPVLPGLAASRGPHLPASSQARPRAGCEQYDGRFYTRQDKKIHVYPDIGLNSPDQNRLALSSNIVLERLIAQVNQHRSQFDVKPLVEHRPRALGRPSVGFAHPRIQFVLEDLTPIIVDDGVKVFTLSTVHDQVGMGRASVFSQVKRRSAIVEAVGPVGEGLFGANGQDRTIQEHGHHTAFR
ncbi:MAG: hypothetical protein GMKNLPBB_02912 [Myxococcota bacterium]|nr:hypothetical protein [Myxococcota bacterium]